MPVGGYRQPLTEGLILPGPTRLKKGKRTAGGASGSTLRRSSRLRMLDLGARRKQTLLEKEAERAVQ